MLREKIYSKRKYVTSLIPLYVILQDFIDCKRRGLDQEGLTNIEIKREYDIVAERYNIKEEYAPSYSERPTKTTGFFQERDNRYLMRHNLVVDQTIEELQELCNLIIGYIIQHNDSLSGFFDELNEKINSNNIENSYEYILNLLRETTRFKNYGQVFEVISFSILKVYFQSFGFELRRISISNSNDSGIDFLSYNGIYQVTSSPSQKKITGDLSKLKTTKRVMVLYKPTIKIVKKCLDSVDVTEVIKSDDLESHFLGWLFQRDQVKPHFMKEIIKTIREEMMRETI